MHNPWREMRIHHPQWRIYFTHSLPAGIVGVTRWTDQTVWLLKSLTQVERRCVLEHERQHILRGETGQGKHEERAVNVATARQLVHLDALLDALRWSRHPHEVADTLWVTLDVLACRIMSLHPTERYAVNEVLSHHMYA